MTDLVPPPRYRPAILPEQRRMLVDTVLSTLPIVFRDYMTAGKQTIYHPEIVRTPGTSIAQAADFMARHEAYRLKHAALYYVAPDMTALAISAGRALPEYEFSAADLPSPYGFLVFDGPYPEVYDEPWVIGNGIEVPAHLTAVAWGPVTDPGSDGVQRPGVWFTYYSDRDASDEIAVERGVVTREEVIERLRAYGGAQFVYDNETLIFEGASWTEIADEWASSTDLATTPQPNPAKPRVGPKTLRTLLAASLLMREPLARMTSEPEEIFTRPERRRLHREGLSDEVRVVHLRHSERAPRDGETEGSARNYTCRWPVVGHWRRQWFPSEQRHRPRYIAPYVKGPDDKPFRPRETVRAWDR